MTASFSCKGHSKSIAHFTISKPERHYVKVSNFIKGICGMKYFYRVAHLQAALFLKQSVYLKVAIFFHPWMLPHSDKSNKICWKYNKNKSNDALDTSLGFDDFRKYLIFTISAWKRDCAMPHISSTPNLESSLKLYHGE